jgi:hypothetical protein
MGGMKRGRAGNAIWGREKRLLSWQVETVQQLLNSRPRKTLDYATPNDIFLNQANLALPS